MGGRSQNSRGDARRVTVSKVVVFFLLLSKVMLRLSAILVVLFATLPGCKWFGSFDMDEAPPAFPSYEVSRLGQTIDFREPPIRTLHAQRYNLFHFGELDDLDEFALATEDNGELIAFGLDGEAEDDDVQRLYEYLLKNCRKISARNLSSDDMTLNTVRCGREFVAGLEKLGDGSVAVTFLKDLDDHQIVSKVLNELNARARGVEGNGFRIALSLDWSDDSSVPLQPGAPSIPAPDDRVWFGMDYLVENTSDLEVVFHPGRVEAIDKSGRSWRADADATARSNGGLEEIALPPGQKSRNRTLIPVTRDVAEQGFRVHFEDLGEPGWLIAYRTINHVAPKDSARGAGERWRVGSPVNGGSVDTPGAVDGDASERSVDSSTPGEEDGSVSAGDEDERTGLSDDPDADESSTPRAP